MSEPKDWEENRRMDPEGREGQGARDPDREEQSRTDPEREPGTAHRKRKASGPIARTKRILALILAVCMILIAAGTATLSVIYGGGIGIRWEDWMENRSYEESFTLAAHARSDMYDILSYVQLRQALEESHGILNLGRPVLAAVLTDYSIAVYSMRDMLEMGEELGISVYEGMSERNTTAAVAAADEPIQIQKVIWSIFDYETGTLNPDSFSFDYGKEDPWDIREELMWEAVAETEAAMAENPYVFQFQINPASEAETGVTDATDNAGSGGRANTDSGSQGEVSETIAYGDVTEAAPESSGEVTYTIVSPNLIPLSEYCAEFLIHYLQEYYIWKEQFSGQDTSLRWQLYLTKNGQTLTYGDPATQRGEGSIKDLEVSCQYDSETKVVGSSFQEDVNMISWSIIKNYLIYDYDECSFYLGINTADLQEDSYGQEAAEYARCKNQIYASIIVMGVSALVFLIVFLWLTVLSGRQDGRKEITLNAYDRLPTGIGLAGIGGLLLLGICDVVFGGDALVAAYYHSESHWYYGIFFTSVAGLVVLSGLLLWLGWYGLVRRFKARTLWRNSLTRYGILLMIGLVRRLWNGIKGLIRQISDTLDKAGDRWWKTLGFYGLCILGNLLLWTVAIHSYNSFFPLMLMIAGNIGIAWVLLRRLSQRRQVQRGIDRIAAGDVDYQLPLEGLSGDSYVMAKAINSISDGLKHAVEEKVKNERMRAELITNVSHDIKTPLTSIINYVDLLKRENIEDPRVQEYLDILEKKADRLRVLTEDLVEASKASSGVLKLNREEIDFVELVNQTNGEFSDRFGRCDLKLICSMPDHPVYILADGRYVWRILENLYRNVEKYALPGTRVYVEVAQKGNRICFVIKNISASELNIRAEELTERFIRGDSSRTTEGSGLGLSIARDLTRLMDGTFQIYLDGDLFRVTVSFIIHE